MGQSLWRSYVGAESAIQKNIMLATGIQYFVGGMPLWYVPMNIILKISLLEQPIGRSSCKGIQSQHVSSPKHSAANNQEL